MATHLQKNGTPVGMVNRNLFSHKRHNYYEDDKTNPKKYKYEVKDPYRYKPTTTKVKDTTKATNPVKTTKPVKVTNPTKVTNPAKATNSNPSLNNPNGPPPQPQPTAPNDNDNPNNSNIPDNPQPTFNDPTVTGLETSSYQVSQTPTFMPDKQIPSGQNRPKISFVGATIVSMVLIGIVALTMFVVYKKRSNFRRGAVRLYDDIDDEDEDSIVPRFLSMTNIKSLRIPSMPPRVQLTRLSSPIIILPYTFSNDNNNNNNNYNNGYLSPYDNLSSPGSSSGSYDNLSSPGYLSPYDNLSSPGSSSGSPLPSSSGRFTLSDYNDYQSQKTESVQSHLTSHGSYTSLESSFPIPPQRDDTYNSTPTSVTFGDLYNLKIV